MHFQQQQDKNTAKYSRLIIAVLGIVFIFSFPLNDITHILHQSDLTSNISLKQTNINYEY